MMEGFEVLRSVLNAPVLDREVLWTLLVQMSERDMQRYQDEVVPYVNGFRHLFEEPLMEFGTIQAFEHACTIAPFAFFFLDLSYNKLRDEDVIGLVQSPYMSNLSELDLENCGIGDRAIIALAQSPCVSHLMGLNLRDNEIGTAGAKAIAQSLYLSNLQELFLDGNEAIEEEGFSAIEHAEFLICLELFHF